MEYAKWGLITVGIIFLFIIGVIIYINWKEKKKNEN
jgi:cbb3-type cytochrome oxidase subunit 3